jgi:hypothetical protein
MREERHRAKVVPGLAHLPGKIWEVKEGRVKKLEDQKWDDIIVRT